jgi:hypothetical protein
MGRMQVNQDAERVKRAIMLLVYANLLLVHLYGTEQGEAKDWSLSQLKQRFTEELMRDQVDRVEQKWLRKWRKSKQAA